MREVICVSIGQAGVQLANAAWELLNIEHGIECDGSICKGLTDSEINSCKTFYAPTSHSAFVPRAIFVDLEPTVIDEVRSGPYRALFHPDQLISSAEDAANNYARGHFTLGKHLIEKTLDRVRKIVDTCDHLQGFLLMEGIGGGTGSGFSSLLLERLSVEFSKKTKICFNIFPGPQLSTAVVEPYNAVLSMHASMEHCELALGVDNEAIYNLCSKRINLNIPTYTDLNRLSAYVFSSITASIRYETLVSADIDQLQTNLVPYPRIHFPVVSYSPFISHQRAEHENLAIPELTRSLFEEENQLMKCDLSQGKYMSCCLMYRGDVTPKDVCQALSDIKKRQDIQFVDWCPTGFKTGIMPFGPCVVDSSPLASATRSVCMLTNSTAIVQAWKRLDRKFDLLFSKRAFVHHFVGEGMEEGEFNEAREDMGALERDYEEAGAPTEEEGDEGGDGDEDEPSKRSTSKQRSASPSSKHSERSNRSARSASPNKSPSPQASQRSQPSQRSNKSKGSQRSGRESGQDSRASNRSRSGEEAGEEGSAEEEEGAY